MVFFLQIMADNTLTEVDSKKWTVKERTWCVQQRLKGEKIKVIQDNFLHSFGKEKAPGRARIHAWMNKFSDHGTVENLNKASKNRITHSGRKRVRDPSLIESPAGRAKFTEEEHQETRSVPRRQPHHSSQDVKG